MAQSPVKELSVQLEIHPFTFERIRNGTGRNGVEGRTRFIILSIEPGIIKNQSIAPPTTTTLLPPRPISPDGKIRGERQKKDCRRMEGKVVGYPYIY